MKYKAKNPIGEELLALSTEDRIKVMKGVVLRRLDAATPLSRDQFETAMAADMEAIRDHYPAFDCDSLLGMDKDGFFRALVVSQVVVERATAKLAPAPSAPKKPSLIIPGEAEKRQAAEAERERQAAEAEKARRQAESVPNFGTSREFQQTTARTEAALPEETDLVLLERGPMADEFLAGLSEHLQWVIDIAPMSTRGFFDNLKSKPGESRTVTMTMEEFQEKHKDQKKEIMTDDSSPRDPRDRAKRKF